MLVDQSILGVLMLLAIDTSEPCRWSQYCSCKLLMTSKSAVSANVDASSQPAASSATDDAPLVMDHENECVHKIFGGKVEFPKTCLVI